MFGTPLGSLVAQLASKSFWNTDMLNESLKQIAHCASRASNSNSADSLTDSFKSADSLTDSFKSPNLTELETPDDNQNLFLSKSSILLSMKGHANKELKSSSSPELKFTYA